MNAEQSACAPSRRVSTQWNQINWPKCEGHVRRLQARIVKATRENRWGKVHALQWQLTHSFSGKALAVKRVTQNQGKLTPGVDRVVWDTPQAKHKAIGSLRRRGYQPQPLRRVYIPKANGKKRPLGIPTMKDRAMQALHLLALAPVAETTADEHSYGFRPCRSTADAIEQCFTILANGKSPTWVLEGDIEGCFDHINHDWILANTHMDARILQQWLKAGYVENQILFPTEEGTPQGGIISPTLANVALDGLQPLLKQRFPAKWVQGRTVYPKIHLIRYADDFIITGTTKEVLEREVRPLVEQFLRDRGLQLSPEKTCITPIDHGFDFLGQNIRKYGGKLLIKPSQKNTHNFLAKVRETIRQSRSVSQAELIHRLNPLISGWVNYHRHIVAKGTFRKVEMVLWGCLWRWAARRHSAKPAQWIDQKYWHRLNGQKLFAVPLAARQSDGKPRWFWLVNPARVGIGRHIKIKADANPFDPHWRSYCADRAFCKQSGRSHRSRQV